MNDMKDTPASLFKRAFSKAFLGPVYRDLLMRYVTDLGLWAQVLADERNDLKEDARRRVRVPWLIEQYQKMAHSIREIETPPDRLTTHRSEAPIEPGRQSPVNLAALLEGVEADARAQMKESPYWKNRGHT